MTLSSRARSGWLPGLAFGLVLMLWYLTAFAYGLPGIVLPMPHEVLSALGSLVRTGAFWRDVAVSLSEFLAGFLSGTVLGIGLGVVMAESRVARLTAGPVVEFLRFIVPFAWIPLTILWFGTSFLGKAVVVAYAVFFVMVVATRRSIIHVDPTLSRVGTMLGMSRWRLALLVHLRAAAPGIASGAKTAAAMGWIAVVAAEYIGASAGLGVMITNAATSLATSVVIAGMIVIGAIGAGVSALVAWITDKWLTYG